MNKKTLILDTTGNDWTDKQIASHKGVDVDRIYLKRCLPLRAIRRYHLRSPIGKRCIWYGHWFQKLNHYGLIIIFSDIKSVSIFKDIRDHGYTGKLCFYYRDPVLRKKYRPNDIRNLHADVFLSSFDSSDAERYDMFFNSQFFFKELAVKQESILYDAVSITSDRGRIDSILSTKKLLDEEGLNSYFYILKDKHKRYGDSNLSSILYNTPLSYEKILSLNRRSRAIVEINATGQIGLTNRAMESLFMKKKLITNNLAIQNLDFYHPDNIYIIGYDQRLIRDFLRIPYNSIVQKYMNYYDFDTWLYRMQQAMNTNIRHQR